jgi:chromate transporter
MTRIPTLMMVFAYLSLLTFGGGMAAYPELETLTVDVYHWLTQPELIHLYSVGQTAPGPNMMMVTAIGERVAGALGALAVLVAFLGPTAVITLVIGRLWRRLEGWPWRDAIQRGLEPVSVGLVIGGCISLARGALTGWVAIAIAIAVFAVVLRTRINPTLLVLGAAVVGLIASVR